MRRSLSRYASSLRGIFVFLLSEFNLKYLYWHHRCTLKIHDSLLNHLTLIWMFFHNFLIWLASRICRLFIDNDKVTPSVKRHLKVKNCKGRNEEHLCVQLKPYDAIKEVVKTLAECKNAKILVSRATTSHKRLSAKTLHVTGITQ